MCWNLLQCAGRAFARALVCLLPISSLAQAPRASPAESDVVIRVSVNLVQVDAVVTNKKGQLTSDLTADDFEILQDGQPQKITNLSFVWTVAPSTIASADTRAAEVPAEEEAPPPERRTVRITQVKRTIAFVVDDLGLSWESTIGVRDALRKFVDQQMQSGDLVAVLRTGGGIGALQSFTSNKRQLRAAIERIRWNPIGRGGIDAFSMPGDGYPGATEPGGQAEMSVAPGATEDMFNTRRMDVLRGEVRGRNEAGGMGYELEQFRQQHFLAGTLTALGHVVQGLRTLPGRKSVVLLSDSISMMTPDGVSERVVQGMRRVTEEANRASVVLYTIDPRGLQPMGLTAADQVAAGIEAGSAGAANYRAGTYVTETRQREYFEGKNGLSYLAQRTGGLFVASTNDISVAVGEVLDDQRGYYLIGYKPAGETFDRKFHRIEVKVKRPGLRVRSRAGFHGVPDTKKDSTPRDRMLAALTSPFGANDVRLKLTGLFANDAKGSFIHCLLHINGQDLSFTTAKDGSEKAAVNVVVVTFGENGRIVDENRRSFVIRGSADQRQRGRKEGFVYAVSHPVRKSGAYQLRAAVRDVASGKIGSASQFIEVPKVKNGSLELSGVFLRVKPSAERPHKATGAESASSDVSSGPAVRVFSPGQQVEYTFQILNAKVGGAPKRPQLETRIHLFYEGKKLFETDSVKLDLQRQTDWKQVNYGSWMTLGKSLESGEYALQFVVTDKLAKKKRNSAVQWIDFEIRR